MIDSYLEERRLLKERLVEVIATFQANHKKRVPALAALVCYCRLKKIKPESRIFSIALYADLWAYDLTALMDVAIATEDVLQINLWSRVLAAHLYDTCEHKIPNLVGKNFREDMLLQKGGQRILDELGPTTQRIHTFREDNGPELRRIRNTVFAHREVDPLMQLEEMAKTEARTTILLGREYLGILTALIQKLVTLQSVSRGVGPAKKWLSSIKKLNKAAATRVSASLSLYLQIRGERQ